MARTTLIVAARATHGCGHVDVGAQCALLVTIRAAMGAHARGAVRSSRHARVKYGVQQWLRAACSRHSRVHLRTFVQNVVYYMLYTIIYSIVEYGILYYTAQYSGVQ